MRWDRRNFIYLQFIVEANNRGDSERRLALIIIVHAFHEAA